MARTLANLLILVTMAAVGAFGYARFRDGAADAREKAALQERAARLSDYVSRLTAERRVAELLVTDQRVVDGVTRTSLLLVEYAADGSPLPAKAFVIKGAEAHLDAMVVQFNDDLVETGVPMKNHTLALFTRLYGDHETPAAAAEIDKPGSVPDYYKGADPAAVAFEQGLWNQFWHLAEDPAAAAKAGVRVAEGQAVFWQAKPGVLYTVTTRAAGGVDLTESPVKGVYRAALSPATDRPGTPPG